MKILYIYTQARLKIPIFSLLVTSRLVSDRELLMFENLNKRLALSLSRFSIPNAVPNIYLYIYIYRFWANVGCWNWPNSSQDATETHRMLFICVMRSEQRLGIGKKCVWTLNDDGIRIRMFPIFTLNKNLEKWKMEERIALLLGKVFK